MVDPDVLTSLFDPNLPETSHWEERYPQRDLPEGALVTRFAPSPTGFLHTGGLYAATIARNLAHHSRGIYFVRIEDTDQARKVDEAAAQFARSFKYFNIESDEDDETGRWGPYEQSKRGAIYESYARHLLLTGGAYLCFCTREELAEVAEKQQEAKVNSGYYGSWARCRNLSAADIRQRLDAGLPYTIRFRAPDDEAARVAFDDLIRGRIEQPDNRNDVVLLKGSDQDLRLPTYHFAHAIDDHLMRVNLVTRGEEWISSVPLHLQLFKALGFPLIPYAHIAPLMKMEGTSRRKLSKRKDTEASVEYYIAAGYPAGAVLHYLRGLANSRLAEMSFEESDDAPIRLNECGVAGPLFDLVKLGSISRDYISHLSLEEALDSLATWAADYDVELAAVLKDEEVATLRVLEMEREPGAIRRKDIEKWSDFRSVYALYFRSLFSLVTDPGDSRFGSVKPETVQVLLRDFADAYEHSSDKDAWFEQIRRLAALHSFAPTAGAFKKAPQNFAGSISDVSNVIRVALTGSTQSPELFRIVHVIGSNEVKRRLKAVS